MTADMFPWPWADKTDLCIQAEMHETPEWAAESILDVEILTPLVIDPCCGCGVLSLAAQRRGYQVTAFDLHDWKFGRTGIDFLGWSEPPPGDFTIFMNPPFSLAVDFVRHAQALGARKIVCFQRFAWWESDTRTPFWNELRPARIFACRSRATCWRLDIPPAERKGRSASTAHSWFVWEKGHPPAAVLGHVDKKAVE
jgi:hypothetical protein